MTRPFNLVPPDGNDPSAYRLSSDCSTTELRRQIKNINKAMTDDETLLPLIEVVHGTEKYRDRLRSTNAREFIPDSILQKHKEQKFIPDIILQQHNEQRFIRDTTFDPKDWWM